MVIDAWLLFIVSFSFPPPICASAVERRVGLHFLRGSAASPARFAARRRGGAAGAATGAAEAAAPATLQVDEVQEEKGST